MFGKKHTKETRIKMSEKAKKFDYTKRYKPIIQYDKDMNFIERYSGIKEARSIYGNTGCITSCLSKRTKYAYGFIWKYEKDTN